MEENPNRQFINQVKSACPDQATQQRRFNELLRDLQAARAVYEHGKLVTDNRKEYLLQRNLLRIEQTSEAQARVDAVREVGMRLISRSQLYREQRNYSDWADFVVRGDAAEADELVAMIQAELDRPDNAEAQPTM